MARELDDVDGFEAEAVRALGVEGVEHSASSDTAPRCPHCNRAMDDIETMDENELLALGRKEMIKGLVRNMRDGTSTHQEQAIFRGLLRDNGNRVPAREEYEEPLDETLPEPGRPTPMPSTSSDTFPDYDETNGG